MDTTTLPSVTLDYRAGSEIFTAGDKAANLFIIVNGIVTISSSLDGKMVSGPATNGELIGEDAIFQDHYHYTARAVDHVKVKAFDAKSVAEAGGGILVACAKRAHSNWLLREEAQEGNIKLRFVKFLEALALQDGEPVRGGLRVRMRTGKEVAERIGSARSTIPAYLGDLKDAGIVRDDEDRVHIIVDMDKLAKLARRGDDGITAIADRHLPPRKGGGKAKRTGVERKRV